MQCVSYFFKDRRLTSANLIFHNFQGDENGEGGSDVAGFVGGLLAAAIKAFANPPGAVNIQNRIYYRTQLKEFIVCTKTYELVRKLQALFYLLRNLAKARCLGPTSLLSYALLPSYYFTFDIYNV